MVRGLPNQSSPAAYGRTAARLAYAVDLPILLAAVIPKRRCVLDRILVGIYTTFLPPPPKTTFGELFPLGWVFKVILEEAPVWKLCTM